MWQSTQRLSVNLRGYRVWGDQHVYPRAVITVERCINENDMDHDGTPNSTPDPSLLVKANTGSPACTPSPIFSDEEADDEATKDGSGSKATSVLASGTDHELDSKNESNEDLPYKSTVANALHNYHSEIELEIFCTGVLTILICDST